MEAEAEEISCKSPCVDLEHTELAGDGARVWGSWRHEPLKKFKYRSILRRGWWGDKGTCDKKLLVVSSSTQLFSFLRNRKIRLLSKKK